MVDYKALSKLAKACRKAGIKHYKCADFEFTLDEKDPEASRTHLVRQPELSAPTMKADIDDLTDEELLLWSAIGPEKQLPSEEAVEN